MVKKIIQTIFLLFVLAAVFSGCSSKVEENGAPVIESDDNSSTSDVVVTEDQEVTNIVEDELVVDDSEAQMPDLI